MKTLHIDLSSNKLFIDEAERIFSILEYQDSNLGNVYGHFDLPEFRHYPELSPKGKKKMKNFNGFVWRLRGINHNSISDSLGKVHIHGD